MANNLKPMVKAQVIQLFQSTGSISQTTRDAGVSRNTVRKVIRSMEPDHCVASAATDVQKKSHKLDFSLLEKLFDNSRQPGDNLDFQKHLRQIADHFADELQTRESAVDTIRLESAILEYIAYRQSFFRAFTAANGNYAGAYANAHDKVAKAARNWMATAQKSFENFNLVIQSLEIKRDQRIKRR